MPYSATFGERCGGFAYGRVEYDDGFVRRGVEVILGPYEPLPISEDELARLYAYGEARVSSVTLANAEQVLRAAGVDPVDVRQQGEAAISRQTALDFHPSSPKFSALITVALDGEIDRLQHAIVQLAESGENHEELVRTERMFRERKTSELERLASKLVVEPDARRAKKTRTALDTTNRDANRLRQVGKSVRVHLVRQLEREVRAENPRVRSKREIAGHIQKRAKRLAAAESDPVIAGELRQVAELSVETIRGYLSRGNGPRRPRVRR